MQSVASQPGFSGLGTSSMVSWSPEVSSCLLIMWRYAPLYSVNCRPSCSQTDQDARTFSGVVLLEGRKNYLTCLHISPFDFMFDMVQIPCSLRANSMFASMNPAQRLSCSHHRAFRLRLLCLLCFIIPKVDLFFSRALSQFVL